MTDLSKRAEQLAPVHPDRKGRITEAQARTAVVHFANRHFNNPGEKSRALIPASQWDDDIILMDYITQREAEADRERAIRGAALAEAAERAKRWLKLNSPLSFKPELVASLEADILGGVSGDWLERDDADSANLARGLAIEQAAQSCEKRAAQWATEHPFATQASKDINAELRNEALTIRSLDPDAAQALAAHNSLIAAETAALIFNKWGITGDSLEAHDAEIERRSREDEAHWWATQGTDTHLAHYASYGHTDWQTCIRCQRIAALAESQPAPATQGKKHWWCCKADFGEHEVTCKNYVGPAPAKEDSK